MSLPRPSRFLTAALLGTTLLASGCSEEGSSTFMEIEPQSQVVASVNDVLMEGQNLLTYSFNITGDMRHPELRADWTVLNREIFIDMYLMRADAYVDSLTPPEQTDIFWTSVPQEGPLFGDRRGSSIILHPCAYDTSDPPQCLPQGEWIVLFFNDNVRTPNTRTEMSATVVLRYFQ
jgi:hypothetical protein